MENYGHNPDLVRSSALTPNFVIYLLHLSAALRNKQPDISLHWHARVSPIQLVWFAQVF